MAWETLRGGRIFEPLVCSHSVSDPSMAKLHDKVTHSEYVCCRSTLTRDRTAMWIETKGLFKNVFIGTDMLPIKFSKEKQP
jgi:hypothetical protein